MSYRSAKSGIFGKPRFAAWLPVFALLALASCSRASVENSKPEIAFMPVWPPAPQQTRIAFTSFLRGPDDFGLKKTIPSRIFDIVFGRSSDVDFVAPYAIAQSITGTVALTDTSRGAVYLLDRPKNKFKLIYFVKRERLMSPVGAAFDSQGLLYITDSVLKKIFVLNEKGKLVRTIGGQGVFERPTGLAIDNRTGNLYVVDTLANKIKVLDSTGNPISSFGEKGNADGQFYSPTNIAISPDGSLAVNDSLNFRVQRFDKSGKFINAFGTLGDGGGDFGRPRGIASDTEGHIYISDALFDVVQIFDAQGQYLLNFGGTGGNIGQMFMPAGICIGPDNTVMVVDQGNKRVQMFRYIAVPEGDVAQ